MSLRLLSCLRCLHASLESSISVPRAFTTARADQSISSRPQKRLCVLPVALRKLSTAAEEPLRLTSSARAQLSRIQSREANPALALRIGVTSGGCSGYQYVLGLADTSKEDDVDLEEDQVIRFTSPTSTESSEPLIVVDNTSLSLIRGSTVDFATELIGSAFKILDNPQSKNKGCGCGVSWELRDDFVFEEPP